MGAWLSEHDSRRMMAVMTGTAMTRRVVATEEKQGYAGDDVDGGMKQGEAGLA